MIYRNVTLLHTVWHIGFCKKIIFNDHLKIIILIKKNLRRFTSDEDILLNKKIKKIFFSS